MTAPARTSLLAGTALVVLAKAPVRGLCKTRLAAVVGDDAALVVYRQLLAITARVAAAWPGPTVILHAGDPSAFAAEWQFVRQWLPQPSGSLGERIAAALRAGLEHAPTVIVIGTDCPGLSVEVLAAVAGAASAAGTACGPATDGGFWAIGTRVATVADVLATAAIPWSAANTLEVTEGCLAAFGLACARGPVLADVDTNEDFAAAIVAGLLTAATGAVAAPPPSGARVADSCSSRTTDLPRNRS